MPCAADRVPDRLWTIGYEGKTPDELVRLLLGAGVRRLVDVRELPMSRKKGFSKRSLATRLAAEGIDYHHLRALGAPREVRHKWRDGGAFEEFRSAYLDHLERQGEALDELERLATERPTTILCVEANHHDCHRHFVGAELGRRGWTIVHL